MGGTGVALLVARLVAEVGPVGVPSRPEFRPRFESMKCSRSCGSVEWIESKKNSSSGPM
jgi:hypothetical protein